MLDQGQIVEQGSYVELMKSEKLFSKLMHDYGGISTEKSKQPQENETKEKYSNEETIPENEKGDAILIEKENREVGSISGKVFSNYLKSSGGLPMGIVQALFAVLSGVIFAYAGTLASINLHNKALTKLLRAPSSFFDRTPLGRIINRFSRDIDTLDWLLPETWRQTAYTFSLILSTVGLVSGVFPLFIIAMVPSFIAFYFLQTFYRSTSRELKRLENISRSPLFAHFSESLTGLATIRSYKEDSRFIKENIQKLNNGNKAYFLVLESQRWLGVRLEFIAGILIFVTVILSVAVRSSVGAGFAGLAISYSIQITGFLNWFLRTFTDTEQSMNSAERLLYYAEQLEEEAQEINPDYGPPSEKWPETGKIVFENLYVRYRANLDPVLKDITFTVKAAEKVAIVGRTGAGKSTIIQTLLRLIEPEKGNIFIDDVDILKLGLFDLRSRLAVIPQEPVLFSGTLRTNLDPFGQKSDHDLWNVLQQVDLKTPLQKDPLGLDTIVSEGGDNWSNGQRQLICLARAMLKNSQIIILDEATASIDLATDNMIQSALRREPLVSKTILTIAHRYIIYSPSSVSQLYLQRLNTVIDYDKILVLDHGKVVEFDSPANLLSDSNGYFTSMVEETGDVNSEMLRTLAKK
ncbi:hypothetical protein HK096_003662 [Nowakowskiella sp. JEL0078]|nr:hypothetical protein HK096_003662 [Nowakowskiella sp. JEL0078]